jgi:hypothetical protein
VTVGRAKQNEYLEVVAEGLDGLETQIYVIRPGGYYTRSADSLRIVPDPGMSAE